jgi:hypothetical protein
MFVRVKDKDTRHEFDVPETDRRIGDCLSLVNKPAYPPSVAPRRIKYSIAPARDAVNTKPSPDKAAEKEEAHHE